MYKGKDLAWAETLNPPGCLPSVDLGNTCFVLCSYHLLEELILPALLAVCFFLKSYLFEGEIHMHIHEGTENFSTTGSLRKMHTTTKAEPGWIRGLHLNLQQYSWHLLPPGVC